MMGATSFAGSSYGHDRGTSTAGVSQAQQQVGGPVLRAAPVLEIELAACARLHAAARAVSGEVTLLGTAEAAGNRVRVHNFWVPDQICSSTRTEVSEEALADFLDEIMAQGIDPGTLRVFAHSHGDMAVFFSSTDENTISRAFPQADWVVSLVVNRRGQMIARLTQHRPFRLELDSLPVVVGLPDDLEAQLSAEVREKVREVRGRAYGCWGPAASDRGGNGYFGGL